MDRIEILRLSNGKAVYIDGKEFTQDEAHEIIIRLTSTWGTDFERQELKDAVLGLKQGRILEWVKLRDRDPNGCPRIRIPQLL